MFIKYQKVRNAVVGTTTAVVGGVAAFFGLQGDTDKPTPRDNTHAVAVVDSHIDDMPAPVTPAPPPPRRADPVAPPITITAESADFDLNTSSSLVESPPVKQTAPRAAASQTPRAAPLSKNQLYASAMKIASRRAPSKKGKDVLGPSSPWKLNLYDDDSDGQWDRGKLDYDRDEVDDERWNFKKGRWEKDGGAFVWTGTDWKRPSANESVASSTVAVARTPAADSKLVRYRQAMKIASRRAPAKKGKDVLGPSSPWKLNLYDDNSDGQWDRGKLDYDRDEVDDEKWNFKKGRWEKDGGASVWSGSDWKPSGK